MSGITMQHVSKNATGLKVLSSRTRMNNLKRKKLETKTLKNAADIQIKNIAGALAPNFQFTFFEAPRFNLLQISSVVSCCFTKSR